MNRGTGTTPRCKSTAPVAKFDTGPIRCELDAGHEGDHRGVSYEDQDRGETRTWPQKATS